MQGLEFTGHLVVATHGLLETDQTELSLKGVQQTNFLVHALKKNSSSWPI
jgi:hypothetical protein